MACAVLHVDSRRLTAEGSFVGFRRRSYCRVSWPSFDVHVRDHTYENQIASMRGRVVARVWQGKNARAFGSARLPAIVAGWRCVPLN